MNKKLFKIITLSIPVLLGCITACSAISITKTNDAPSSKKHYSMYDFNSIDDLLNFDAVNYGTFCFDPNTDYTNGNREVYHTNPEEYIPYLNNITADMFKPENLEKTKDFLAFALLGHSLFSLLYLYDERALPVEMFADHIHNNVKSFSLHIDKITNLKLEEKAADGRDTFSFSGGWKMNLVAKNYKDNEYHNIQAFVNYTNKKVWFTQFGSIFQEQEVDGVLYHLGAVVVDLQSESDEFATYKTITDGETWTSNGGYMQSIGTYPSTLFYEYIKDLQISNDTNP